MGLACVSHTQEQSGQSDTNGVEAEVSKPMREAYPSEFHYTGNRAVSLDLAREVPEFPTRAVVAMALTYHRNRAAR